LLTEVATALVVEAIGEGGGGWPQPLFNTWYSYGAEIGVGSMTGASAAGYEPDCTQFTDTFDLNPVDTEIYPVVTNATTIYFRSADQGTFANGLAAQVWAADPR
jgi:hypothetical protein